MLNEDRTSSRAFELVNFCSGSRQDFRSGVVSSNKTKVLTTSATSTVPGSGHRFDSEVFYQNCVERGDDQQR